MKLRFAFKSICTGSISLLLSGCLLLNDTKPYRDTQEIKPDHGRALIIIGMGVESANASSKSSTVGLTFDEYDIVRQNITGNCWKFNHFGFGVPATSDKVQYKIFDVPPGFYTTSAFDRDGIRTQEGKAIAFSAPAGQVVYIGDFVWTKQQRFELHRNFEYALAEIKKMYPEFRGNIVIAESLTVTPPRMFLCMP